MILSIFFTILTFISLVFQQTFEANLLFMPPRQRVWGHINLPLSVHPFVCPGIDTWFVRLSPPTVLELQL